jgi:hypothetical protein
MDDFTDLTIDDVTNSDDDSSICISFSASNTTKIDEGKQIESDKEKHQQGTCYNQSIIKQHQMYSHKDGSKIDYDHETLEYFRALRKTHCDPITLEEVDESIAFKFPFEWDPYTGERRGEDPYGALYFNPDILIHTWHSNRLNHLWEELVDNATGHRDGYYSDALGNGPNFHIKGRGEFPEWFLFRLPITDCYLTKDHNSMVVTLGPILTYIEVCQIYSLAESMGNSYAGIFNNNRPNIVDIYKYYKIATNPKPDIKDNADYHKDMSNDEQVQLRTRVNKEAVELLKRMRG